MGTREGNIIVTIIATHMPRNDIAAADQACPGMRIHVIDIVQPPGMGIPPRPDIDSHHRIVTAVPAAKSSAEPPRKVR